MPSSRDVLRRSLIGVALLGLGVAGSADATRFGVRVVDVAGEPVPGASVCVGLEGSYRQFGAMFTDRDGNAMTEVPDVPLVVTVSKTRFAGIRMEEPARRFDLVKRVTLSEGMPGPRCRAGSTLAESVPGGGYEAIRIHGLEVAKGTSATTIDTRVSGSPTEYRVSSDDRFDDADWQRYAGRIALPSTLTNEPSVFLQFRRYEGGSNGWLEARSEVATVTVPAR